MHDRRRTRISTSKEATLRSAGGSVKAFVDNLSLKGCLVKAPDHKAFPVGAEVELTVHLEPGSPQFDFGLLGEVVRVEEQVVAVDFKEIPPESFQHLMRLVQYNAEDPEEIEQELGSSVYGQGEE